LQDIYYVTKTWRKKSGNKVYNLNESTVDYRWKWTQFLSKVLIQVFPRECTNALWQKKCRSTKEKWGDYHLQRQTKLILSCCWWIMTTWSQTSPCACLRTFPWTHTREWKIFYILLTSKQTTVPWASSHCLVTQPVQIS